MKKIPNLFLRDWIGNHSITQEPNPECDWVFQGQGIPTIKIDGTCCLIKDGKLYKRYEVKKGKKEPEGFVIADHDLITGKKQGWLLVSDSDPTDQYHILGLKSLIPPYEDGTYELIGPKIQGNPEKVNDYRLIKHGSIIHVDCERSYNGIKAMFLENPSLEGIVYHHTDGRMAKIRLEDYNITRNY